MQNRVKHSLEELLAQRAPLAQQMADLQLQLHSIDAAIEKLADKGQDKVVRLEMTKGQAGMLMGALDGVYCAASGLIPPFGLEHEERGYSRPNTMPANSGVTAWRTP